MQTEGLVPIRLSIIICSFNRAADLKRGLPPLLHEVEGQPDVEILVVDNASTDPTPEIVRSLQTGSTPLRYLREERPGANYARNTGWRSASGEIIAYLDDDAVVEPGWVDGVLAAFGDPETHGMAGRIFPGWPRRRPWWLPAELESLYSAFDWGTALTTVEAPYYPWGANMAILRADLEAAGGFATNRGRKGGNLISNDEQAVFRAVRDRGGRVVYQPAATVIHHVPRSRVRLRWLLRRSWSQGRSDGMQLTSAPSVRSLIGNARPRVLQTDGESKAQGAVRGAANSVHWLGVLWEIHLSGSRVTTTTS